ncbi:hypothetical protein [uncultured Agrobacterium sp.]|uniref:hypothetical protein n=1 Tax=uncultured Agrobacterium sp. TaxID=157277 RepID=UPI0025DFEA8E|nr:hypothetical protein [uncultured Agrobacterium sp.]
MAHGELSLFDLNDRILLGGKVREEHVWSYVKLSESPLSSRHHPSSKRFSALLEAGAIFEALLLLAQDLTPPAELCSFQRVCDGWVCAAAARPLSKPVRALHQTLEGAIFLTLLKLSSATTRPRISSKQGAIS